MAGRHNDTKVLDHSLLYDKLLQGKTSLTNYVVNGHQYTMDYYLTDGIYHKYAMCV